MTLAGADPETVRAAIESGDPLPGTAGFAGELDGRLVRDVLGRYPLFFERKDPTVWSHDRTSLSDPRRLPAGHVHDGTHDECIWTLPQCDPVEDDIAVATLREALDGALATTEESWTTSDTAKSRTAPDDSERSRLAVAFSGGVDSGLLAARLDVPLYVVGFPDSHDVEAARSGGAVLGRDVRVVELDHATLERAIPEVARALGRTNAMDVAIALPLYLVAERVRADGFDALALGQGADELFGGYAKVALAPDDHRVEADTVRGARREVLETLPDQLERDVLALRAAGIQPVTPLLDDDVIRAALALSGDQLVRGDTRKWAFRQAAREWLPEELAFREKKALQYGSLVSRELDRLARQAGFKRRMDDHVTRYIESLQ